jgi:hypothetical protein
LLGWGFFYLYQKCPFFGSSFSVFPPKNTVGFGHTVTCQKVNTSTTVVKKKKKKFSFMGAITVSFQFCDTEVDEIS